MTLEQVLLRYEKQKKGAKSFQIRPLKLRGPEIFTTEQSSPNFCNLAPGTFAAPQQRMVSFQQAFVANCHYD